MSDYTTICVHVYVALPVADDSLYNHISRQFTAAVNSLENASLLGFLDNTDGGKR